MSCVDLTQRWELPWWISRSRGATLVALVTVVIVYDALAIENAWALSAGRPDLATQLTAWPSGAVVHFGLWALALLALGLLYRTVLAAWSRDFRSHRVRMAQGFERLQPFLPQAHRSVRAGAAA